MPPLNKETRLQKKRGVPCVIFQGVSIKHLRRIDGHIMMHHIALQLRWTQL